MWFQSRPALWDGGLGTIKGGTAHLKLKENVAPQFFKPRTVPFVLKEKVTDELKKIGKNCCTRESRNLCLGYAHRSNFEARCTVRILC